MKKKLYVLLVIFIFVLSYCSTNEMEELKIYEDPVTPEGIWLLNNINVLDTVEPDEDNMDDLKRLTDVIGDAQVVGLGEATHGTSEFFKMKHRIFRSLAVNKNFKIYILEQDLIPTFQLNKYIVENRGTASTWFWYIPIGEYFDLIEWMHLYNITKSYNEKIWIFGCDILSYHKHIAYVRETIEFVDSGLYDKVSKLYSELSSYSNGFEYYDIVPEKDKKLIRNDIKMAMDEIIKNKDSLIPKLGQWEYDLLERAALVVIQSEDFYTHKDFPAIRDKYMFDNIEWIRSKFNNAKIVHSSHNEHISTTLRDDLYKREWDSTGFYLREKYQNNYISIGFTFYEGSFHTYYGSGVVGPALDGSFESFFEQAKRPIFGINLRVMEISVPDGDWIRGPRPFRHIDERFYDEMPDEDTYNIRSIIEDFDWVIYIKNSTPYRMH